MNAAINQQDRQQTHGQGHRVRARITLEPVETTTARWRLPSGTRSLLFQFTRPGEEKPVTLGGVVTTNNDAPLAPGVTDLDVLIDFWADEAAAVARPGARFAIWYANEVGRGDVLHDVDAPTTRSP